MGQTLLLVLGIGLLAMQSGCGDGHLEDVTAIRQDASEAYLEARAKSDDPAERTRLVYADAKYHDVVRRLDSLFQEGPRIRYYSNSLAHEDSLAFTNIVRLILSSIYNHQDTTLAVLTYIEYLSWMRVLEPSAQMSEAQMYADATGEAMVLTQSPHMARLAYQAFARIKQMALAYGDTKQYLLSDSSYKAVARQVLSMPDSVRVAFGPPPDRPTHMPWVLATLAAAFIAASVAGIGWKATNSPCEWYIYRKREGHRPEPMPVLVSSAIALIIDPADPQTTFSPFFHFNNGGVMEDWRCRLRSHRKREKRDEKDAHKALHKDTS